MTRARAGTAAVLLVACILASPAAHACSYTLRNHVVDATMAGVDAIPPVLPEVLSVKIVRAQAPKSDDGCGISGGSSCDDIGRLVMPAEARDDRTPPDRVGYRFTLAAGALPAGLTLPEGALDPEDAGVVTIYWGDGGGDTSEALDFTLRVVAIDQAGNESAPQTVRVQQSSPGGGCRVARAGAAPSPAWLALGLAALLLAVRRRAA